MYEMPYDCQISTSYEEDVARKKKGDYINGSIIDLANNISGKESKDYVVDHGLKPDIEIKKIFQKVLLNHVEKAKLFCFQYMSLSVVADTLDKTDTGVHLLEYLRLFEDIYYFLKDIVCKIDDKAYGYKKTYYEIKVQKIMEIREKGIDSMSLLFDKSIFEIEDGVVKEDSVFDSEEKNALDLIKKYG